MAGIANPSVLLLCLTDEQILIRADEIQYIEQLGNDKTKFYFEGRTLTLDVDWPQTVAAIQAKARYPNANVIVELIPNP